MEGFSFLLQPGDASDTSVIDTWLRSQEKPTPSCATPSCAASEMSDVSDEEPELPSAHKSWVPTPYFAQLSGYNRLHVAMHAINEVCLMLWRMHAYFRYLPMLSTWKRRKHGMYDVSETKGRHGWSFLTTGAGNISSPIRSQHADPEKGSGYNRFYLVAQCYR